MITAKPAVTAVITARPAVTARITVLPSTARPRDKRRDRRLCRDRRWGRFPLPAAARRPRGHRVPLSGEIPPCATSWQESTACRQVRADGGNKAPPAAENSPSAAQEPAALQVCSRYKLQVSS